MVMPLQSPSIHQKANVNQASHACSGEHVTKAAGWTVIYSSARALASPSAIYSRLLSDTQIHSKAQLQEFSLGNSTHTRQDVRSCRWRDPESGSEITIFEISRTLCMHGL